jgi:hypothetical protein
LIRISSISRQESRNKETGSVGSARLETKAVEWLVHAWRNDGQRLGHRDRHAHRLGREVTSSVTPTESQAAATTSGSGGTMTGSGDWQGEYETGTESASGSAKAKGKHSGW